MIGSDAERDFFAILHYEIDATYFAMWGVFTVCSNFQFFVEFGTISTNGNFRHSAVKKTIMFLLLSIDVE